MMKMLSRGVAALLLAACASSHASLWCTGTVSYLGVGKGGALDVALSGSAPVHINNICSMSSQGSNHADVATCKATYALLLEAHARGDSVRLYYEDPAVTSCDQIANWSAQPSFYWADLAF